MKDAVYFLKKEKKVVISVFLLAFVLRLLFFLLFLSKDNNYITADSYAYNRVAKNFVSSQGCSNSDNSPQFYRLPGYPIFLAFFYKLFSFSEKIALFFQLLLSSLIPILVFVLSFVLFPKNILSARLSSICTALHPGFIIFSGLMMTETLFIFFFILFLIFFFSSFDLFFSKKFCATVPIKKLFGAGFLLGFASMVRPLGHYFIFLCFALLIFSKYKWIEKLKSFAYLLLGWLIIVTPWLVRNFVLTGAIFFNTLPGDHFFCHTAAYINMHSKNISYDEAKKVIINDLRQLALAKLNVLGRELTPPEKVSLKVKIAAKYILNHPYLFVKHAIVNILKTAFMPFSEEIFFIYEKRGDCLSGGRNVFSKVKGFLGIGKKFWVTIFLFLELILSLFLVLGFFCFSLKSLFLGDYLAVFLKVFPVILFIIFISLVAGFARLRLPIEPLIVTLSCSWWTRLFENKFFRMNRI